MLALLAIMTVALLVGRFASRITPTVELVLLALITVIVLAELASWGDGGATGASDFLRALIQGGR
jgi:ammonia channel protein AmtB